MENLLQSQNKKSFSMFSAALASVMFILFNFLFLQIYSLVPNSTISGNIVISNTATINGKTYDVKKIDEEAFYAGAKITNIKICSGIEEIGESAFAGTGIYTIFIPASVKTIKASTSETGPFYACRSQLVIYLEAEEVPEGFEKYWNYRTEGDELTIKTRENGYSWQDYLAEIQKTDAEFASTNDNQVAYTVINESTAMAIKGQEGFSKTNKVVYYLASFLVEFLFAVVAYIVAKIVKTNIWKTSGMDKKINGKIILLGLAISIICLLFFSGLTEIFLSFLYTLGYSSRNISIEIPNFAVYLIYVVISCLVPAICEELLFRGVILSGLKEKGEMVALFGSTIIFTLMHGSPDQTIHQFIIGFIVGYLFIKSGNLWLGVIIHFFNNFIAITETYIFQMIAKNVNVEQIVDEVAGETEAVSSSGTLSFISVILSLFFVCVGAYLGYMAIKYLAGKLIAESNRINGVIVETEATKPAETNLAELETQTTISIDGTPAEAQMTISGESASEVTKSIDEEARQDFEDDELFAEIQQEHEQPQKKQQEISLATILMFAGAGIYLVVDWLIALISGF